MTSMKHVVLAFAVLGISGCVGTTIGTGTFPTPPSASSSSGFCCSPTSDGTSSSSSSSTGGTSTSTPPTPDPRVPCKALGAWPAAPVPEGTQILSAHACPVSTTQWAWAVGTGGYIAAWNGVEWTRVPSPVDVTLNDVVCVGPSRAYAVGQQGVVLAWDGFSWVGEPADTQLSLFSVAAGPTGAAWAAGGRLNDEGVVLKRDGGRWTVVVSDDENALLAVSVDQFDVASAVGQQGRTYRIALGEVVDGRIEGAGMLTAVLGDSGSMFVATRTGEIMRVTSSAVTPIASVGALITDLQLGPVGLYAAGEDGTFLVPSMEGLVQAEFAGLSTWRSLMVAPDDEMCGISPDGVIQCVRHDENGALRDVGAECGRPRTCVGGLCAAEPALTAADLVAITQAPPATLWAVGRAGTILRNDGLGWGHVPSGTSHGLNAVHAARADAVWAVGDAGTVLRWNGTTWILQPVPTTADLTGVHGLHSDDVWVSGKGGTLLHWNGLGWATVETGFTDDIHGVLARSPGDVWLLRTGTSVRYTGMAFDPITDLPPGEARTIASTGTDEVWVGSVGETGPILHRLRDLNVQSFPLTAAPNGIFIRSAREVLVGLDGGRVATWNGSEVGEESLGHDRTVRGLRGADDGTLWAVGAHGLVQRRLMTGWDMTTVDPESGLESVFIAPNGEVWGAGPRVYRWNATGRREVLLPFRTHAVWGALGADIWLVGEGNRASRWQGALTQVTLPVSATLRAVWGSEQFEVWAVGDAGAILRFDGFGWANRGDVTTANLHAVHVTSNKIIAMAGDGGTLIAMNGTQLLPVATGVMANLRAVRTTMDEIIAVGEADTIVVVPLVAGIPGEATQLTTGTGLDLMSITEGTEPGTWLVGTSSGELLSWERATGAATRRWVGVDGPISSLHSRGGAVWAVGAGTPLATP